jgi:hypothetical protein
MLVVAGALALAIGAAGARLVQCAGAAPLGQADAETALEGTLEVLIEDSNATSRTRYFLIAGTKGPSRN